MTTLTLPSIKDASLNKYKAQQDVVNQACASSSGSWVGFLDALGIMESSRNYGAHNNFSYAGMYQFGNQLLNEMNFYTGIGADLLGVTNQAAYLNNPIAQELSALIEFSGLSNYQSVYTQTLNNFKLDGFTQGNFDQLLNHTFTINYIDATTQATVYSETVDFTPAGISAAAHLLGAKGTADFMADVWNSCFNVAPDVQVTTIANLLVKTSILTSPDGKLYTRSASYPDGNWISDGNNIPISTYINLLQNFNIDSLINSIGDLTSFNSLAETLISYDSNIISDYLTSKKLNETMTVSSKYYGTIQSILRGLGLDSRQFSNSVNKVILAGGNFTDSMVFAGTDLIYGLSSQSQKLTGGSGNDVLIAGSGQDTLDGGLGSNTYVFTSGNGLDVIEDNKEGLGKIMLNGAQLQGTTSKPTAAGNNGLTWTDGSTQYRYVPGPYNPAIGAAPIIYFGNVGTLFITSGGNSILGGNNIVVENFDLAKATDLNQGYLGIHLGNFASLTAGASTTLSVPTDATTNVVQGMNQTVTIAGLAGSNVQLSCDGAGTYKCSTGANLLAFSNGSVNLTIPQGQDYITVTLIDTSTTPTDTATLSATITDASGNPVTSNTLTVNFNDLNPAASPTPTPTPGADYTYTGDHAPQEFTDEVGADIVNNNFNAYEAANHWAGILSYSVGQTHTNIDAGGNTVILVDTYIFTHYTFDEAGNLTEGASDPGRNDTILDTTGNDYIDVGSGSNWFRSTGGNDSIMGSGSGTNNIWLDNGNSTVVIDPSSNSTNYITARNGNNNITLGKGADIVIAGNGNNIIAGGGGQDYFVTGNGNNQIYADAKVDLAIALASQKNGVVVDQLGDLIAVGNGNNTVVGSNANDTIYTSGGNNTIVMGNGKNYFLGGVQIDTSSASNSSTLFSLSLTTNVDPAMSRFGSLYYVPNITSFIDPASQYYVPGSYYGNSIGGVQFGLRGVKGVSFALLLEKPCHVAHALN